jgi:hypothetical protein
MCVGLLQPVDEAQRHLRAGLLQVIADGIVHVCHGQRPQSDRLGQAQAPCRVLVLRGT